MGYTWGGNYIRLTPREMARFGQLFLREGEIDGDQIVPASWVAQSTSVVSGGEWFQGIVVNQGYGYGWWNGTMGGHDFVYASGHGGQVIAIFADLDLVIVTTAHAHHDWYTAGQQTDGIMMIIRDEVLPAVLDN